MKKRPEDGVFASVKLPKELHEALVKSAEFNERSLVAEIVFRLKISVLFPEGAATQ